MHSVHYWVSNVNVQLAINTLFFFCMAPGKYVGLHVLRTETRDQSDKHRVLGLQ